MLTSAPETPTCGNDVPAVVSLLAEHLDRVLAAGEDLLKLTLAPSQIADATQTKGGRKILPLADFIAEAQRLELSAAMRLLRAREHTRELQRVDARFKAITDLFLGGTTALTDALDALANPSGPRFDAGDSPVAYLQTRGLMAQDAGAPPAFDATPVGEHFRVAGAAELGQLMDLVAAYLDAIEVHYDVFPDAVEAEERRALTDETQRAPIAA